MCGPQLKGLRTDYGAEHIERCGHAHHGACRHTGALVEKWDAAHPIHLVGHSFGGCTALVLLTLRTTAAAPRGCSASRASALRCAAARSP